VTVAEVPGKLTIRPFDTLAEYEACVRFQEDVWGGGFSERVSAAILKIANRLGGLAAGAFDRDGTLHGFVFGLTGVVDGALVHWSDMLAVREGERNRGLGTRLKAYQREVVLARGVKEMRWTFDPLQGRNAYVNFAKLGIVCREYVENMYGVTDSPLHGGIATDRMVATWELDSPRAKARLGGEDLPPAGGDLAGIPQVLPTTPGSAYPFPGEATLHLEDPRILLAVPGDASGLMEEEVELAVRWREATRKAFAHYFSRGYQALEFIRGHQVSSYLLVRPGAGEAECGFRTREPESREETIQGSERGESTP
jgi:chorismate synthase